MQTNNVLNRHVMASWDCRVCLAKAAPKVFAALQRTCGRPGVTKDRQWNGSDSTRGRGCRLTVVSTDVGSKKLQQGDAKMKTIAKCAVVLLIIVSLSGTAVADTANRCTDSILKGRYVFTASGFTRAVGSAAGTPWSPKAILEVLQFNGDGTLTTPGVTVANPFGDSGDILHPPAGAAGTYSIAEDCSGTVQFSDQANVTFNIMVDPPLGDTVWMIQTNPADNVFQGIAKRVW